MQIRNIYYFLLYPLFAFILVCLYSCSGIIMRCLAVIVLAIMFAFNFTKRLSPNIQFDSQNTAYVEVVNYLEENHITTVFSGWNRGEKIAIASDCRIKAGFWDSQYTPFVCINYLCDPSVFNVEASHCAYIFFGDKEAAVAAEKAASMNADFTLERYFPDSDIYVFSSKTNLMRLFSTDDGL